MLETGFNSLKQGYINRISKSPLEFNDYSTSIRKFLESEQENILHLQMFKGDG
jgi:hypothetical protein